MLNRNCEVSDSRSRKVPVLLRLAIGLAACLTVCAAFVVSIPRAAGPAITEPPANLLPGHALPVNIHCGSAFERHFECRIRQEYETVYMTTEGTSQIIVHTSITASNQTLGHLVVAWGDPIDLARYGRATYVFWSSRWAYLADCSLQPGSMIVFIGYGEVETGQGTLQHSAWHGFVGNQGYECPPRLN